jgi:hypothetical protein
MRRRLFLCVAILGLAAVALFAAAAPRNSTASGKDCYAGAGPAAPTLCD